MSSSSSSVSKDVTSEFRTNYDYERVSIAGGSPLYVQSPGSPPIAEKRYLYNNSHAVTVNQLFKLGKDSECTVNAHYYTDRIKKDGYSLYEQYLPGDSIFAVEERVHSLNKMNHIELAMRMNTNAENYYLNNVFTLRGNWDNDIGTGITRSNAGGFDETLLQRLNKPSFAVDNTLNIVKNLKNNSYKVYFSAGYGQRPHSLTVAPANYFGDHQASSLTQDMFLRDFASVLRVSYGLKKGHFNLDYSAWGGVDVQNMDTELYDENVSRPSLAADSLKNNLWYNSYRIGINQDYVYHEGQWRLTLNLPATYEIKTVDDRIPEKFSSNHGFIINPSFSATYELTPELELSAGTNFIKSLGDMNSNYTGLIMHGYRSLQRNTIDRLFETHSINVRTSATYRNAFEALLFSAGFNYRRSWRNLLYGYDYSGIVSIKNTMERPTTSEGYSVNISGSKGLDFWRSTVRLSGNYSWSKGEQLVQNEILRHRSQGYGAGGEMNFAPFRFIGAKYSISWNRSRSYAVEQIRRFPPITGVSQDAAINFYPTKTFTINFNVEHRYNSAASSPHTAFADAGVKFKRKRLDLEVEVNNIFNTKQYVSASYSDVSANYYSCELRPISILISVRFKLI